MRFVELSQHGCAMVIVVPSMNATGQRGSVHAPSPPLLNDQYGAPPVYTNSMSLGLRQFAIAAESAVYPVSVLCRPVGSAPAARSARTPFTYSWRVRRPAGAGAAQMPMLASDRCHPVIRAPPLITGCAPAA